jgi:hypothetical protein
MMRAAVRPGHLPPPAEFKAAASLGATASNILDIAVPRIKPRSDTASLAALGLDFKALNLSEGGLSF